MPKLGGLANSRDGSLCNGYAIGLVVQLELGHACLNLCQNSS